MKIRSTEYSAWQNMRKRYEFVERWNDYDNFIKDIGQRPSRRHILQRIDRTQPCSKKNCRWGIDKNNFTVSINYRGKEVFAAQLADQLGIKNKNQFVQRIRRGWEVERAMDETPRYIKPVFIRKGIFKRPDPQHARPTQFPPGYGFAAYSPLYRKTA